MTGKAFPAPARPPFLSRLLPIGVPLVDQGVVSGGTFLFNAALARLIPLSQYGRFALILGILSLMQTGCGAIIFYPLAVRGAAMGTADRKRLILSALILTLVVGLPLAAALGGVVWWFIDASLFIPATVVFASGQIKESLRRSLLTEFRHGAAIPGDAVSYIGQVVLLVVFSRSADMTLESALWIMAATSFLGAAVQLAQIGLPVGRPFPLFALMIDFWRLGHWSLTSNFLVIARTQSLLWLLTLFAGPEAAGACQIATNLVNVTNPIVFGVCNIIPQAASRALRAGYRAAWEASWPMIAAGLALVSGFVAILCIMPGEVLGLVYGAKADPRLLAMSIYLLSTGAVFNYASMTVCAYLFGVLGGRDALIGDVASTVTMAIAAPLLILADGLNGGAAALLIAYVVRTGVLGFFTAERVFGARGGSQPGGATVGDHPPQGTPA